MSKISKLLCVVVLMMSGCSTGFQFGIDVPIIKTHHNSRIEVDEKYIIGYAENGVAILRPERIIWLEEDWIKSF